MLRFPALQRRILPRGADVPLLPALLLALWIGLAGIGCNEPPEANPVTVEAINETANVGVAYLEENDLENAEAAFRRLIELAPERASAYANLGVVELRRGRFEEAETHLRSALERDPADPAIWQSLIEAVALQGRLPDARAAAEQALATHPDYIPLLYQRARLYGDDPALAAEAAAYMAQVVRRAPANLLPRLHYVENLVAAGAADSAMAQLEALRMQLPNLPAEAAPHYGATRDALQQGDLDEAARSAHIFHNLMRATPFYQTGLRLLDVRTDALVGVPVISEPEVPPQSVFFQAEGPVNVMDELHLTDASENAGLTEHLPPVPPSETLQAILEAADFNGDSEIDLAVALRDSADVPSRLLLFQGSLGRFQDVTAASGIGPVLSPRVVQFADYDNDTFLDLFVTGDGLSRLYRNTGTGAFQDVTTAAGLTDAWPGRSALFADVDHDGDLDLFIGRETSDLLFRNNGDGTFTETGTALGVTGAPGVPTEDAALGDFDDDGDLDFLVLPSDAAPLLYDNLRQTRFENIATRAGLAGLPGGRTVEAGDYNNDGFLDLFFGGSAGAGHHLYRNRGDGTFERDAANAGVLEALRNHAVRDAHFADLDNDGLLDLVLGGDRLTLLHNAGRGTFADVSEALLGARPGGGSLQVGDYNLDRDLDVFVGGSDGTVRLLRNDGGNLNKALTVQTRGLLTGNNKNNYYSIGAKLEVRSGDLYQMRLITEPVTHIGLGQRLKADVIRIVFTNGVPQNIFRPGSDQDIIEDQILKGSCPLLYTWNGERYQFVTDLLWRSALGMPLPDVDSAYAPAVAAQDYVKIRGDLLQLREGRYELQVTAELWETPFFDEARLIVVDHPDSVDVFIDERFGPPEPEPVPMYVVSRQRPPRAARDDRGRDVLPALRKRDSVYVATFQGGRYQGVAEPHDLILDLGELRRSGPISLFLNGWVFPTDASINVAMRQTERYHSMPPQLQVLDARGRWQTVIPDLGFPKGKNKTMHIDLTGKFLTDRFLVRVRTNMEIYWDHAFVSTERPDVPLRLTPLRPTDANLHYRGFSEMYRPGAYGPHLHDYARVTRETRWQDLEGAYTRFGQVLPLLAATDDQFVIMNAGDELTLTFDAEPVPPVPEGWSRDFIFYTNGYLKDGDLNTAHGQTVEPLPYAGMPSYPYPDSLGYPMTEANRAYLETYNTRVVTADPFRNWLRAPRPQVSAVP